MIHHTLARFRGGVCLPVLLTATLLAAPGLPYAAAAEAPVVSGLPAATASSAVATLEKAAIDLKAGRSKMALEGYRSVLNDGQEGIRAQARLGAAYALSKLGDDAQALRILEGTVTDATPLGQALGIVRANLFLQLSEKAIFNGDGRAAEGYLNDFDRLTVKTDRARYERLRTALGGRLTTVAEPFKIAVILPFSGNLANVSENILMGFQAGLATGDLTAKRLGVEVLVTPYDTTAEGGVAGAVAQARSSGAKVILGPLLSKDVDAAADALNAPDGSPSPVLLSLSSDRAVNGDGVYTINYLPTNQAQAIATWAMGNGRNRLAALVPSTPYGYEVFDSYKKTVEGTGQSIAASSFYNAQNVDIGASVRQLAGNAGKGAPLPFDAVLLPAPAASLPLIASQLAYHSINASNVQLLGTGLWQNNDLLKPSASALRGGVFAVPPRIESFINDFNTQFGATPHPLAQVGFDAARVLSNVAAEYTLTKKEVSSILLRPEGFLANGGFLRFRSDGQTERSLAIVKVGEGVFETLQPALEQTPLELPNDLLPRDEGRNWRMW